MQKKMKDVSQDLMFNGVKKVEFSVNGTYLVGLFSTGFWLYGGEDFKQINFFPHLGVLNVRFSPN
jgi:uncharacterized protein with WD repeat